MKKKYITTTIFIVIVLSSYAQFDFNYWNKDIELNIRFTRVSDSLVSAECWLRNRNSYPIYYTNGNITDTVDYRKDYYGHPVMRHEIFIDMATTIYSPYIELSSDYYLLTLEPLETVILKQMIKVPNINDITVLKVIFDYLNPNKYSEKIIKQIILKDSKNPEYIKCKSYTNYCNSIGVEIDFTIP
jgi:hypothetical protein